MTEEVCYRGRLCGIIDGEVYKSRRETQKHFYVMGRGYPISNDILKLLKYKGVKIIKIIEVGVEKERIFQCSLEKYLNAVMIEAGGFEQQRCVPLKEMELIT